MRIEIGHESPKQNIVNASNKSVISAIVVYISLSNKVKPCLAVWRGSGCLPIVQNISDLGLLACVVGQQLRRNRVGFDSGVGTLGVKAIDMLER